MKKLNEEKELRKKYTNKLKVDDALVKKISLIFKIKNMKKQQEKDSYNLYSQLKKNYLRK